LMRLCIQKLVPLLSQNGKGLDEPHPHQVSRELCQQVARKETF
jgi:hypothetical protein